MTPSEPTLLTHAEQQRQDIHGATPRSHKSAMGQFMTPASVATFMAGLFQPKDGEIRLLDAGAGLGALTCATLDRWLGGGLGKGNMSVQAYEVDDRLREHLIDTLSRYEAKGVRVQVNRGDYLDYAAEDIEQGRKIFTHAILNPPYKKIHQASDARHQARRAGLETVNLYSAFVGLALAQLQQGGQLVAIIPRSFCNGPYYKPFRRFLLERAVLRRIHLFDSRTDAFKDDDVLQETVILHLEKGEMQGDVSISHSKDDQFTDIRQQSYPFGAVVKPGDPECFIHVPEGECDPLDASPHITSTLKDLEVSVSTGPVVDFRATDYLRKTSTPTSVPLLYPQHFNRHHTVWPVEGKKPNAIERVAATEKSLFAGGTYVVVKRFSSKEEKRRVVASLVHPVALGNPEKIGFENHLNVYHQAKGGLPEDLAWGLFVYLNSTVLDDHLRRFSGHTQVNATDLKNIRYPDHKTLEGIGRWAQASESLDQEEIDTKIGELLVSEEKIREAIDILECLGMPTAQANERSALSLLALTDMRPDREWSEAESPLIGITPIMSWMRDRYGKVYAPNTRETVRRQTMHQFVSGGIAAYNPDQPSRAVNSPSAAYQITPEALTLVQAYGTAIWEPLVEAFIASGKSLAAQYAKARDMEKVPVKIPGGGELQLSPGEHSELIKAIVEVFGGHFVQQPELIYVGDTGQKVGCFDRDALAALGVVVDNHGKMPDVVLYDRKRHWLILAEAASSHGPVDGKRHAELAKLFSTAKAGLVYVSAFPDRATMRKYLADIAWETEVWAADAPTHLIHFNGVRFLGPYDKE